MTGLPLVVPHPKTGEPCFRYHEPWPQSKTTFDATDVAIEGVSAEESAEICAALDALLRDRRNTLWHSWENGDLLVSDNTMAMHTRSDFKSGAPRELWRIHFD
ncbi:Isocyanide synthase xanB like protein [Verticillium longisporum]|nr:Isocyanide synthase xanB like protein [Verticillium longisporum]